MKRDSPEGAVCMRQALLHPVDGPFFLSFFSLVKATWFMRDSSTTITTREISKSSSSSSPFSRRSQANIHFRARADDPAVFSHSLFRRLVFCQRCHWTKETRVTRSLHFSLTAYLPCPSWLATPTVQRGFRLRNMHTPTQSSIISRSPYLCKFRTLHR